MKRNAMMTCAVVLACFTLVVASALAQSSTGEPGRESGKPISLKNVYFGEQHLHTVNSADAFAFGTRNTPDDAYRFCKGEAIKIATTGETRKKRPMTGARSPTTRCTWASCRYS